jgi:hypothetical protein
LSKAKWLRKSSRFHGLFPAQAGLNLFHQGLPRLGKSYFETSKKKQPSQEKEQLKKIS